MIFHINIIKQKCYRKIKLLKKLTRTTYGSDKLTLLKLYGIFIRPVIDYSSPISHFTRYTHLNSLKTVLSTVMGAFHTTLSDDFSCEASEPLLYVRSQCVTTYVVLHVFELISLLHFITYTSFLSEVNFFGPLSLTTQFLIFQLIPIPPWKIFQPSTYKIVLPPHLFNYNIFEICNKIIPTCHIFIQMGPNFIIKLHAHLYTITIKLSTP